MADPQTDYFRSQDGNVVNSSAVIFTEVDNTNGLSSQSPKDNEHTCYFTEVSLKQEVVPDFFTL